MMKSSVLLASLVIAFNVSATTYFIDYSAGSDSSSGTSTSSSWQRHPFMKGFAGSYTHHAGDRFIFKGGVTWPNACFNISVSAGGTAAGSDYYGVDRTWFSGTSWARPIFNAAGAPMAGLSYISINTDYVTVDGIEFTGFYWDSTHTSWNLSMISPGASQYITVINCYMHNWSHDSYANGCRDDMSIICGPSSGTYQGLGNYISNCVIMGTVEAGGYGSCRGGIYQFPRAYNCTIGNVVDGCLPNTANAEVAGCTIGPILASFQQPYDNQDHPNGVEQLGGGTISIHHNIIHDTVAITIFVGNPGNLAYIYDNLIYNSQPIPIQADGRSGAGQMFVYNNTIVYGSGALANNGTSWALVAQNNHFIGGGGGFGGYSPVTQDHNLTQTASAAASAGYTSGNLWQPTSATSPTVDQGTIVAMFNTDRLNGSRPFGAAWDIGAYEYGATVGGGGGGGSTNVAPVVSPVIQNAADVDALTAGLQVYTGTAVQLTGSATDANHDPLTWQWIYTVNSGAEVIAQSGSGSVAPMNYVYPTSAAGSTYVWILRVSDGQVASQSQLTVGVEAPPPPPGSLTFSATSGSITAPFVVNGTYISQPSQTTVTTGGRAAYTFTITNAGSYVIQGLLNAPSDAANSFYVNIDAEPQDPSMVWQIPLTSGFENRIVNWQGAGTYDNPQFVPKIFSLANGTHQLIIRGREANTQLDTISFIKLPPAPQNLHVVAAP